MENICFLLCQQNTSPRLSWVSDKQIRNYNLNVMLCALSWELDHLLSLISHEHCTCWQLFVTWAMWLLSWLNCFLLAQFLVSVCALVCAGETRDGYVADTVQLLDLFLECNLCIGLEFLNISGDWSNWGCHNSSCWGSEGLDSHCPFNYYFPWIDHHWPQYNWLWNW